MSKEPTLAAPRPVESEPGMPREEKVNMLRGMVHHVGWQHIFKPAVRGLIDKTTAHVMTGTREKGEENISDEALKQRALALSWILSWETRYVELAQQLHIQNQIVAATEPGEGVV